MADQPIDCPWCGSLTTHAYPISHANLNTGRRHYECGSWWNHDSGASKPSRICKLTSERDAYRNALIEIANEERPNHDHYEDPAKCAHCRSYLLLGLETQDEQQGTEPQQGCRPIG